MKTIKGRGGYYYSNDDYNESSFYNGLMKDGNVSMDKFLKEEKKDTSRSFYKKGGEVDIEIKHPGSLHREMDIPMDEKIPMKALKKEKSYAERNDDSDLVKKTTFAINARGWDK